MGCTSSKEASHLESAAASSAATMTGRMTEKKVNLTQISATLPGPDTEQANNGKAASVQNRLTLGAEFADC
ncbi:unnamed protein product, partial [Heterosigma akashiwo]